MNYYVQKLDQINILSLSVYVGHLRFLLSNSSITNTDTRGRTAITRTMNKIKKRAINN